MVGLGKNSDEQQLFMESAWLLYENRERILSDSRMAYAPINMHNSVIWVGDGVFDLATVGVYLEWWKECKHAMVTDKNGQRNLVVQFIGSTLSGGNRCKMVAQNGTLSVTQVKSFRYLWQPFWHICHRYADAGIPNLPYSLEEVISLLSESNDK